MTSCGVDRVGLACVALQYIDGVVLVDRFRLDRAWIGGGLLSFDRIALLRSGAVRLVCLVCFVGVGLFRIATRLGRWWGRGVSCPLGLVWVGSFDIIIFQATLFSMLGTWFCKGFAKVRGVPRQEGF